MTQVLCPGVCEKVEGLSSSTANLLLISSGSYSKSLNPICSMDAVCWLTLRFEPYFL